MGGCRHILFNFIHKMHIKWVEVKDSPPYSTQDCVSFSDPWCKWSISSVRKDSVYMTITIGKRTNSSCDAELMAKCYLCRGLGEASTKVHLSPVVNPIILSLDVADSRFTLRLEENPPLSSTRKERKHSIKAKQSHYPIFLSFRLFPGCSDAGESISPNA